ncbi:hypothetical protein DFJ77DRAFT_440403 [Powellomyces hirtus]|nr:hypothetical protein DFJ77DRAFT_440403 [Powellomyces hirtus]
MIGEYIKPGLKSVGQAEEHGRCYFPDSRALLRIRVDSYLYNRPRTASTVKEIRKQDERQAEFENAEPGGRKGGNRTSCLRAPYSWAEWNSRRRLYSQGKVTSPDSEYTAWARVLGYDASPCVSPWRTNPFSASILLLYLWIGYGSEARREDEGQPGFVKKHQERNHKGMLSVKWRTQGKWKHGLQKAGESTTLRPCATHSQEDAWQRQAVFCWVNSPGATLEPSPPTRIGAQIFTAGALPNDDQVFTPSIAFPGTITVWGSAFGSDVPGHKHAEKWTLIAMDLTQRKQSLSRGPTQEMA